VGRGWGRASKDDIIVEKILPEKGPNGYTDGFNSKPKPFECRWVVRIEKHRETIEREWEDAKETLAGWE